MKRAVGTKWRAPVLFVAVAVSDCAAPMRTGVAPRPMGADLPTYRPAVATDVAPRAIDAPTGAMTLGRALRLAFEYSPILEAQAWETASHHGVVEQAALLPNPEFFTDVENVAGSGDFRSTDSAETTFGVAIPLELGGKRAKRTRLAQGESQGTPPQERP